MAKNQRNNATKNEQLACKVLRAGLVHDGQEYDEGDEVQMTRSQAEPLAAIGVVQLPVVEGVAAQE